MIKIIKSKNQKRKKFFDDKKYESDIIGEFGTRKGRSSKKDKFKNKADRERDY